MHVTNLEHVNQYIIYDNGTYTFQSYDSECAYYQKGKLHVRKGYWNYSSTTLRHFYIFIERYCDNVDWYPLYLRERDKKHPKIQQLIYNLIEKGYIDTYE